MARRPATFRQSDVTRAIEAVKAAGEIIGSVEVDSTTGKIIVIVGAGGQLGQLGKAENEPKDWDAVS